jgi:Fic family protein
LILFQIDPDQKQPTSDDINNYREVDNYARAIRYYFQGESKLPVSLRLIRDLHRILLSNVRGEDKLPGEFRRTQNQIGRPARYVPPSPDRLLGCLDNLEKYMYEDSPFDPLVKAFIIHYQFEAIHPFLDGNGRVGRLLLAILIKEWCGLRNQWLYMSSYFDSYRDQYIDNLFEVSTESNWYSWIEYCLRGVIQQSNDTQRRCDQLIALLKTFRERLGSVKVSGRSFTIAEDLFITPFIQIPYIAKKLDVEYKTAESDIEKLINVGILKKLETAKIKTYYSPDILSIAYS